MAKLKDVKKIECMNLSAEMKQAVIRNNPKGVCEVAQKIFEAGYELEDMKLLPGLFEVVASVLITSGWTPQFKEKV